MKRKSIKNAIPIAIRTSLFFAVIMLTIPRLQASANDSLLLLAKKEKDPSKYNDKYLFYLNKLSSTNRDSAAILLEKYTEECKEKGLEKEYARAIGLRAWFKNYDGRYEEGLKLLREAVDIQKRLNDSIGIALNFNRLGVVNMRYKRYKQAEEYILLSLAYYLRLGDSIKIDMAYNNLGGLYLETEKFKEGIACFIKTVSIRKASKNYYNLGYAYYNIAEAYLAIEKMDSAEYYFKISIKTFEEKTETGLVPPMVDVGFGNFYFKNKNYLLAKKYAIKGLNRAKEIDHKEILLSTYHLLSEIYSASGEYKPAFEMQSKYVSLKDFIDSVNSATQITEIEEKYKNAEKTIEISKLKYDRDKAELKALSSNQIISRLVFFFLLLGVFVWYTWMRRNQNDKLKQAELGKKIAEAKMFALKAQMNPHFVFNCINTAQNFVINNQKEQAFEYLSNFAKLLRLVMENSAKSYIPIEDELQQLQLYIELESIRFDKKFSYRIFVDPELENGVFEIPGMVMQPIIENAIGHGLVNRKQDGGELLIQLSLLQDSIHCEIIDNGVGRKKAAEIKAQKIIHYSSAAIPNIKERLIMLQGKYHFEIIDLFNGDEPAGTKVVLDLPYR